MGDRVCETMPYQTARAYVQAIVDAADIKAVAIDRYADELAETHWQPHQRGVLLAAMTAFVAGYSAGHDDGYGDGLDGELGFALNMIVAARIRYGGDTPALTWIEGRIIDERDAFREEAGLSPEWSVNQ